MTPREQRAAHLVGLGWALYMLALGIIIGAALRGGSAGWAAPAACALMASAWGTALWGRAAQVEGPGTRAGRGRDGSDVHDAKPRDGGAFPHGE